MYGGELDRVDNVGDAVGNGERGARVEHKESGSGTSAVGVGVVVIVVAVIE